MTRALIRISAVRLNEFMRVVTRALFSLRPAFRGIKGGAGPEPLASQNRSLSGNGWIRVKTSGEAPRCIVEETMHVPLPLSGWFEPAVVWNP